MTKEQSVLLDELKNKIDEHFRNQQVKFNIDNEKQLELLKITYIELFGRILSDRFGVNVTNHVDFIFSQDNAILNLTLSSKDDIGKIILSTLNKMRLEE